MAFAIDAEFKRNDNAHITCTHSSSSMRSLRTQHFIHSHARLHTTTHCCLIALSHSLPSTVLLGKIIIMTMTIIMIIVSFSLSFIRSISLALGGTNVAFYLFIFWLMHCLNSGCNGTKSTTMISLFAFVRHSTLTSQASDCNQTLTDRHCDEKLFQHISSTYSQSRSSVIVHPHRCVCIRHLHVFRLHFHFRKSLKFICSWTRNDWDSGIESTNSRFFLRYKILMHVWNFSVAHTTSPPPLLPQTTHYRWMAWHGTTFRVHTSLHIIFALDILHG